MRTCRCAGVIEVLSDWWLIMVDMRSDDQKRTDAYAEESHRVEKAYEFLFGDGDDYDYGDDEAPDTLSELCDTFGLTEPVPPDPAYDIPLLEHRWDIAKQFLPDIDEMFTGRNFDDAVDQYRGDYELSEDVRGYNSLTMTEEKIVFDTPRVIRDFVNDVEEYDCGNIPDISHENVQRLGVYLCIGPFSGETIGHIRDNIDKTIDSVTSDRQRELWEHVNETFVELNVPEGLREKAPQGKISSSYERLLNNVLGRERETEGPEL